MEKSSVRAIGTRVIIRGNKEKTTTDSGIYLYSEETTKRNVTNQGYVVAVGDDCTQGLKVGDLIIFEPPKDKKAYDIFPDPDVEGEFLMSVWEENINAVVEP